MSGSSFLNFVSHYFVAIVLFLICYFWYVSIISRRNSVLEALSGIDVQLKNRSELIPNILIIAKKFMDHEEKIFIDIATLRETLSKPYNQNNPSEVKSYLDKSSELSQKMTSFMLRTENYPEVKSNQNMLQAQQSYAEIESQIAAARRFYNSSVVRLKNSIQIFPGNLLAKIAGIKEMPLYQAEESAKQSVNATDYL